jgi:hypothetical protein
MKNKILIITIVLSALAGCFYDNEEYLYPKVAGNCDTLNISFSATIFPILNTKCLSCHSNTSAAAFGNSIKLQDYADVKSREQAILGSVKHLNPYSPMPKNSAKLNACPVQQIEIWIKAGGLNN